MSYQRKPWSISEDACLLDFVQSQKPHDWIEIAQKLGSRTAKQCRERYHQKLEPSLNHKPITPEEGAQIEHLVSEIGKRWTKIARKLHGRSDNSVKNWWYARHRLRIQLARHRKKNLVKEEYCCRTGPREDMIRALSPLNTAPSRTTQHRPPTFSSDPPSPLPCSLESPDYEAYPSTALPCKTAVIQHQSIEGTWPRASPGSFLSSTDTTRSVNSSAQHSGLPTIPSYPVHQQSSDSMSEEQMRLSFILG